MLFIIEGTCSLQLPGAFGDVHGFQTEQGKELNISYLILKIALQYFKKWCILCYKTFYNITSIIV